MSGEPRDAPMGAKHELPSTDLVAQRKERLGPATDLILSDDEMRRCWRLASGLAASGMFKGVVRAEQAFAKILIGRDIGISPTRALMGIDLVQGGIQMRGVLLGNFVRKSPDYDYRILEQTPEKCRLLFRSIDPDTGEWRDEGESEFTIKEAKGAGLVKTGGAWENYPKNMLLWRAMSNGVKFYCPDLLGGIPVYTEADEIPAWTQPGQLGEGTGDGEPEGLELGPAVEAVLYRARGLGHAGLSDRASAEVALGDQPPAFVEGWVRQAHKTLDAFGERPVEATAEEVAE